MKYQEAMAQLNSEQRKAVEQTEGVVMVVAGPGTGKTQMLSARVAQLIEKQKVKERSILCLTFTDAATNALRDRLFSFVGASAHRVGIHTYHSFCNYIIQDNKDLFGWNDLSPATDLDLMQILHEIIDELPKDHLLKRFKGDVYYDSGRLTQLFKILKKEYLDESIVKQMIEDHKEAIKLDENFRYKRNSGKNNKGDLNKKYYDELKQMEKLGAAIGLFSQYQKKLADRRLYDYDDMITWVIEVFKENPTLKELYQEQIEYLLVDEYQDTNGAQNELISLLLGDTIQPNVFVVGDDDQSIYRFQGANVENITEFYQKYKENIELIVLDKNYRSNQEILDCATSLISANKERLVWQLEGLSKELRSAKHLEASQENKVRIRCYENNYQEIVDIAARITALGESGTKLNEIAILYRNHKQSDELIKYLENKKIAYQVVRTQNALETPIIQMLLKQLRYLVQENGKLDLGQSHLFHLLHFRRFKHLGPYEIAKLSLQLKSDRSKGWRERLMDLKKKDAVIDIKEEALTELLHYLHQVENWLSDMHNTGLETLLVKVMSEGEFISTALSSDTPIFNLQCLKSFFQFLKEETSKTKDLDLASFLNTIDLLNTSNIGLKVNNVSHAKEGVQLMTAHGSKGLEFDHVFIISATEKSWERKSRALPFRFGSLIKGSAPEIELEEARRLFYVAMTRARKSLNISYAEQDENGKSLAKCVFVAQLIEERPELLHRELITDQDIIDFFSTSMQFNESFKSLTNADFIDQRLQAFKLSPSNLNAYLKCPVDFFYNKVLGVPQASSESMLIGSAVHRALEVFFKMTDSRSGWKFPSSAVAIEAYQSHLLRNKESFSENSFQRSIDWGSKHIPDYIENWLPIWSRYDHVLTELNMEQLEFKGIPIHGQIDKLILSESQALVVDYKTGKYQYAKTKLKAAEPIISDGTNPKPEDNIGGDYWRQLVFYKILMDVSDQYDHKVETGIIDFIEKHEDQYMSSTIPITLQDVEIVGNQIVEVYQKIKNKQFEQGCMKEDCQWCSFTEKFFK